MRMKQRKKCLIISICIAVSVMVLLGFLFNSCKLDLKNVDNAPFNSYNLTHQQDLISHCKQKYGVIDMKQCVRYSKYFKYYNCDGAHVKAYGKITYITNINKDNSYMEITTKNDGVISVWFSNTSTYNTIKNYEYITVYGYYFNSTLGSILCTNITTY